jgi:hypothetical protein
MSTISDDLDNLRQQLTNLPTTSVDLSLNVRARLADLYTWDREWRHQDDLLYQRIIGLDGQHRLDGQRAASIALFRERLERQRLRAPLEISSKTLETVNIRDLRNHLVTQFVRLTPEEKLFWLNNFLFIMTPDLREVTTKIAKIIRHRSFGQQRCFLLGGLSGMGKTTYLNWVASHAMGVVEADRNIVPFILVNAPESNLTARTLPQRMIEACGMISLVRASEEDILNQLSLFTQACCVVLVGVDEVENIRDQRLRRRLLDISNRIRLPIICASCMPKKWAQSEMQVAGRWNDFHELKQFTGSRLKSLLGFIELLLPLSERSYLTSASTVKLIEQWTGGILRDIMTLMIDAGTDAINGNLPALTPELLRHTWETIQREPVHNFLEPDEE